MSIVQRRSESIGFRSVELFRHQTIGAGSYGAVFKARCNGVVCAAKMLHSTLMEELSTLYGQGALQVLKRFQQECDILSALRHPNIVQYLGTHQDSETGLPILLMELMDESLTHFLENSTKAVAYHTEVNFCCDIALALSFLHLNDIVHRDLSSNNVLLDNQSTRAKVTDFGMSRLGLNPQGTFSTLTMCPGTMVYMPPEAIQNISIYSDKLDCFSFGVLIIQILTRKFPNPSFLVSQSQQLNSSSNSKLPGPVSFSPEVERRWNHIHEIHPDHPLLKIALKCLDNSESERPSASELYDHIDTLKEYARYSDSLSYESIRQCTHNFPLRNVQSKQMSRQLLQEYEPVQDHQPVTLCDHQRQQLSELNETLEYTLNKIQVLRQVTERKKSLLNSLKQAIERSDTVIAKLSHQMKQKTQPKCQQPPRLYTNIPLEEQYQHFIPSLPQLHQQQVSINVHGEKCVDNVTDFGHVKVNESYHLNWSTSVVSHGYKSTDVSLTSDSDTLSSLSSSVSQHRPRRILNAESDNTRTDRNKYYGIKIHTRHPEKKSRSKREVEEHPLKKKGSCDFLHNVIDPGKHELSMLKELRDYTKLKRSEGTDGYVAVLYTPSSIPSASEQWEAVLAVYPRDVDCGHPFLSYLAILLGSWPRPAPLHFNFSSTECVLLEIHSEFHGYHIESNPEQFVKHPECQQCACQAVSQVRHQRRKTFTCMSMVDKKIADSAVCDYSTYPPRCILTIIPACHSPPRLNAKLVLHGAETKSSLRLKLPRVSNTSKSKHHSEQGHKPTPKQRRTKPTVFDDVSLTASSIVSSYEVHDGGSVLNEEPEVKEFMHKVGSNIPAKWEGMAYEFGLKHHEVEYIRMTHGSGTCGYALIRAVFVEWKKQSVHIRPTWHLILKALRSRQVNEKALADQLKKHLSTKAVQHRH